MLQMIASTRRVSDSTLVHEAAMHAATNYKKSEIKLLQAISLVEEKKIYLGMQITSLFQYCVEMLGLSRHTSYDLITVMRTSKEVPQLLEAISLGEITVSKARKICAVITPKNHSDWIGLARECSTRIVEKCVAMANPRAAVVESMKYVSSDTLEFRLAVSEQWSELLCEIKDLKSQELRRAVSSEEAIFLLMKGYKRKHDPVLKAERANLKENTKARSANAKTRSAHEAQNLHGLQSLADQGLSTSVPIERIFARSVSSIAKLELRKRRIPSSVTHAVNLRDQGRCAFVDRHGQRCSSKRWVELHHVKPFSEGGEHTLKNIKTLCWAHHCMEHRA